MALALERSVNIRPYIVVIEGMITQRVDPTDIISILPPRDAEADSMARLIKLRDRFAVPTALRRCLDRGSHPRRPRRARRHLSGSGVQPGHDHLGFLSQVLSEDHSRRDAVTRTIAHRAANGLGAWSPNTASYCNARGRLPTGVLRTLAKRSAQELQAGTAEQWRWNERGVVHRRRVARLHARHAGEPGGLPAAADATVGPRLPVGPSRRPAVAGDRRPPRPGHGRRTRARGPARPPSCGSCTEGSSRGSGSSPTPCSTTIS